MRAYRRGVERFREGHTPRNVAIVAAHTKIDSALLARACWAGYGGDFDIDPRTIDVFQDWALSHRLIDRRVTVDEFWTPRFVQATARGAAASEPK